MLEMLDYLTLAPQLNADVSDSLITTIDAGGIEPIYQAAKEQFDMFHRPLRKYLLGSSVTKNGEQFNSYRNVRRAELLQIGATVSAYAY